MKKNILICCLLIVVTCLIAVVYWNFISNDNEETSQPNLNNAKYILNDQYDNIQTLEQYRGKKIILIFWQIWCPPCQSELMILNNLYETLGNNQEDVILLTITKPKTGNNDYEGDKTIDEIKEYLTENNYKFPVLFDTESAMYEGFDVNSFPTTVIINQQGNEENRVTEEELNVEEFLALVR